MNYIDQAREFGKNYLSDIPKSVLPQMGVSCLGAALICGFMKKDYKAGFWAGIASSLVVAIHAFVTPLFKKVIGNRQPLELTWSEEMCRAFIGIFVVGVVAAIKNESIIKNLFIYAVIYGFITHIQENRRNFKQFKLVFNFPIAITHTGEVYTQTT